jgi:hypothetical protein
MLKLTRRVLIKQASIAAGTISMLAATLTTKRQLGNYSTKSAKAAEKPTTDEALVICITDPASGTLTILRGEHETTINNAALVQHLVSL